MKTDIEIAIDILENQRYELEDALQKKGIVIDCWGADDVTGLDETLTPEQVNKQSGWVWSSLCPLRP